MANLQEEIERLKSEIESQEKIIQEYYAQKERLQDSINKYNEIMSEQYFTSGHNERGAGRKTIITDDIRQQVSNYRQVGKSYREIAAIMGIAVGTAYKAMDTLINK